MARSYWYHVYAVVYVNLIESAKKKKRCEQFKKEDDNMTGSQRPKIVAINTLVSIGVGNSVLRGTL